MVRGDGDDGGTEARIRGGFELAEARVPPEGDRATRDGHELLLPIAVDVEPEGVLEARQGRQVPVGRGLEDQIQGLRKEVARGLPEPIQRDPNEPGEHPGSAKLGPAQAPIQDLGPLPVEEDLRVPRNPGPGDDDEVASTGAAVAWAQLQLGTAGDQHQGVHASPTPSASVSSWSTFTTVGQLSQASPPSKSADRAWQTKACSRAQSTSFQTVPRV